MIAPRPLFSSVIKLIIVMGLMLWGVEIMQQREPSLYWVGFALTLFMGIFSLKQIVIVLNASLHAASQNELYAHSQKNSGQYGKARLANVNDKVIQELKDKRGFFLGCLDDTLLFYNPFASSKGHMISYAPSRTGKTTSLVIAAALHWFGGSLFLPDIKGEITKITSLHRQQKGHRVITWNPFNVLDIPNQSYNPLYVLVQDILTNSAKNLHDLILLIASQLIPKLSDKESGAFFRNGGRKLLVALMLYLAVFKPRECNLPTLRDLVWSSSEEKLAIANELTDAPLLTSLLKGYGNTLIELLDPAYIKTYGPMRDYAQDATQIFDANTSFGKSLTGNDFDLDMVLDGKTTIFPIIPEDKLETHGKGIGLMAALLFEKIAASKKSSPIMMLLEEFGNLGVLPNIKKALTLLPGKGCRCWIILQSRRQNISLYGENTAKLIEEQSGMIQQWAIRDLDDRKRWSERIGNKTEKAWSLSHDPKDPTTPWKPNVNERAAPVFAADHIGRMSNDWQLISIDASYVILAERIPYFQIEPWRSQAQINPYHPEGYPKDKPVRYGRRG